MLALRKKVWEVDGKGTKKEAGRGLEEEQRGEGRQMERERQKSRAPQALSVAVCLSVQWVPSFDHV